MPNDHWNTPRELLERVEAIGPIALDPCSNSSSIVVSDVALFATGRARGRGFVKSRLGKHGGLDADWLGIVEDLGLDGTAVTYVNPKYSDPGPWVRKCIEESWRGCEIVLLVPSDSGVRWFQDAWRGCDAVCLPDHRLAFLDEKGKPAKGNRGSSAVFYFGDRGKRFLAAFHGYGVVVVRTRPPAPARVARAEAAE